MVKWALHTLELGHSLRTQTCLGIGTLNLKIDAHEFDLRDSSFLADSEESGGS